MASQKTILIADDSDDYRQSLGNILVRSQYIVIEAANGKEAIEKAFKERPSIIILDAKMPLMDGYTACEKIKNDPRTKDIPIIMISGTYQEVEDMLKGIEKGAKVYRTKTDDVGVLVGCIKEILGDLAPADRRRGILNDIIEEHKGKKQI